MSNKRIFSLASALVVVLVTIGGSMVLSGVNYFAAPTVDLGWGVAFGMIFFSFSPSYKLLNKAQTALKMTMNILSLAGVAAAFSWAATAGVYELASNDFMLGFVVASILGLALCFAQDSLEPEEEAE